MPACMFSTETIYKCRIIINSLVNVMPFQHVLPALGVDIQSHYLLAYRHGHSQKRL